MYKILFLITIVLTALVIALAVVSSIFAALEHHPLFRKRLRLTSGLFIGLAICVPGIAQLSDLLSLPVLSADGIIASVTADGDDGGKDYLTKFTVGRGDGATFHLNAYGKSQYFRTGQRVSITYYGYTGSVIKARFLSSSGAEEATFKIPSAFFYPCLMVVAGGILCWLSWRNYSKWHRNKFTAATPIDPK